MAGTLARLAIDATDLLKERFMRFVMHEPNTGCWLWNGGGHGREKDYGGFGYLGKKVYAHRIAFMLFRGKVPEGLCLDHLCKTPRCVNPDHLEPVTLKENVLRGRNHEIARKYNTCKRGHVYTEGSYCLDKNNNRVCLVCKRINKGWDLNRPFKREGFCLRGHKLESTGKYCPTCDKLRKEAKKIGIIFRRNYNV